MSLKCALDTIRCIFECYFAPHFIRIIYIYIYMSMFLVCIFWKSYGVKSCTIEKHGYFLECLLSLVVLLIVKAQWFGKSRRARRVRAQICIYMGVFKSNHALIWFRWKKEKWYTVLMRHTTLPSTNMERGEACNQIKEIPPSPASIDIFLYMYIEIYINNSRKDMIDF